MREQSGCKFDPALVDCLFGVWDQAMDLRRTLPD
jgi:response regulator RpfG family c-di-GMP phosphodiesterase